jgi:RNA polymerase sigma factor (sigma-70 family)
MMTDAELLHCYATTRSEPAFAELVQRHLGLVYHAAVRRCGGDAHLAEDVTQQVFAAMARESAALASHELLTGWLYVATRNLAGKIVRVERARRVREEKALLMNEAQTPEADWTQLRPVLDDVMDELGERERDAVLLRFFENRPFAEIGAALRVTEDAARMRVDRALDKLRVHLARRGVTSTTAALAAVLTHQAAIAAPVGLAATVTGATVGVGASAAAGGWIVTLMGMTKLQIGIAGAVAVLGVAGYVSQSQANAALQQEIAQLQSQQTATAALRAENRQLANTLAEVDFLRRDDAELERLAQGLAETKKQREETARVVQARVVQAQRNAEAQLRELERQAQEEIQRLNVQGSALVTEYRAFAASAQDQSLAADVRAQSGLAAQAKLEEIKTKQREVQEYVERKRAELEQMATSLGLPPGNGYLTTRLQSRAPAQGESSPGVIRVAPSLSPEGAIQFRSVAPGQSVLPPGVNAAP